MPPTLALREQARNFAQEPGFRLPMLSRRQAMR